MQAYHRKRHKVVWLVLLPVAILLLLVAVWKRPDFPQMPSLPFVEEAESGGN